MEGKDYGSQPHPVATGSDPLAPAVVDPGECSSSAAFVGIIIAILGTLAVLTSMLVLRVVIAMRRRRHFQAALAVALAGGRVTGWPYEPDIEALQGQGAAGEEEDNPGHRDSGGGQGRPPPPPPPPPPKLPTIVVHPDGKTVDFAVKDPETEELEAQDRPSEVAETARRLPPPALQPGRAGTTQPAANNDFRPPMGPPSPFNPYMNGNGALERGRRRRQRRAHPSAAPPPLVIIAVPPADATHPPS